MSNMPPSETATTSFLLGNLHCPTCVSSIKTALKESCGDQIFWVSPNVVTSVVTVQHRPTVPRAQMRHALEESGFEVCSETTETGELSDWNPETTTGRESQNGSPDMARPTSALARWYTSSRLSQRSQGPSQSQSASAHLLNCEQCRNAAAGAKVDEKHVSVTQPDVTYQSATASQSKLSSKAFIVIETDEDPSVQPLWRVSLAIGGMTCAACANGITNDLSKKDWVANVTVNLIGNSATVDIKERNKVNDLIEAIEDLGYDATLDTVVDLAKEKPTAQTPSNVWRATLAIGGMTCAACVTGITDALQGQEWVKNVTVNLISNSAVVDFQGIANKDKIVEAIEGVGYEAVIDSVVGLAEERPEQYERTVEILIEGLYCDHCSLRVANSLAGFRRQLQVITPPTRQKPIIKISYVPEAPSFTVRQILAAIEATDPEFSASIYHPPTLEEMSKRLQRQHQRQIFWRVLFTGVVCIPTFVIGIVYMSLLPDSHTKHFMMQPWTSGISRAQIALFIMATPVYFFAADLFHRRAFKEIRTLWRRGSRVPVIQRFYRFGSMNTLMSLGTSIAYISSVSQLIAAAVDRPEEIEDTNFYFDSVVFLTFFLLLGRLIESYSKSKTGDAVEALAKLRPTTATLVEWHGTEKEADVNVNADMLEFGDIVRVNHGGSPPADGVVVQYESNFDESSLTGESRLVKKVPGDEVFSGTVNKDASVLVRITGAAGQSMLDQIVKVVREGQTKRAPIEQFADILTAYFVPAVVLVAVLTWITWMSLGFAKRIPGHFLDTSGGWVAFSLQFAISVFVVACPCGLALAAPTAIFVGGGLAAKYGILAKGGGIAFEEASRIDCVVFDKTGTLTVGGEPTITDSEIYLEGKDAETTLLAALKAVEESSSHPIAKAIVAFCTGKTSSKAQIDNLQEIPGKGMKATSQGQTVGETFEIIAGNESFMKDHSVVIPESASAVLQKWMGEAKSVALVSTKPTKGSGSDTWTLAAVLSISDPIRPEAPAIVRALESRGTSVWMLSGDNQTTAVAVAAQVGIPADQVIAGVLPTGKADQINYLQKTLKARRGKNRESESRRARIAMVGDGINDSPALAMADVGIAIGSGSDVAISTADFVLVKSDLRAVVNLLDLSKTVFRRIKVNFGWALVYNVIAIPIAAGVLYPITNKGEHVRLDPVWASLAMALSSISVVLSSLALKSPFLGLGFKERKIKM
ncbi:E1-E2 ATPase-domain-containing protein [Cercophora newfieldiana]|uniref:E1-E2 ATPase-domain-containing protein n=1 Tax=Cercophora newfieldiana TaxID=92897 RepID=A0AA39XYB2_9PEZI|nr:E1-E2 ATPase-domain-containing protein [Cercophora newfieldiana]